MASEVEAHSLYGTSVGDAPNYSFEHGQNFRLLARHTAGRAQHCK